MLTLGFVETVDTIKIRNKLADQLVEQAKKSDPSITISADDARLLADDLVITAAEAGQQVAQKFRPKITQLATSTGTRAVAPLLIASTCFGLAGLAAIVGLWRPE